MKLSGMKRFVKVQTEGYSESDGLSRAKSCLVNPEGTTKPKLNEE
jgi:hypothetical protein